VWRLAGRYAPDMSRPMTWLINIVRNRAIDALRAQRIREHLNEPLEDRETDGLVDFTWHRPQAPRPEDTGHGNARRAVGALGILGFPRSSCDRGGISCHEAGPQKSAGRFTFRNGLVSRSIDLRKVTSVARA
jgi:hypothetical protein